MFQFHVNIKTHKNIKNKHIGRSVSYPTRAITWNKFLPIFSHSFFLCILPIMRNQLKPKRYFCITMIYNHIATLVYWQYENRTTFSDDTFEIRPMSANNPLSLWFYLGILDESMEVSQTTPFSSHNFQRILNQIQNSRHHDGDA